MSRRASVYRAAGAYMMPELKILPADVGLLFGTRHGVETFVEDTLRLWQRGAFRRLIVSGGASPEGTDKDRTEAEVIGEALVNRGFPAEDLLLETCARNTLDNVRFSRRLLRSRGLRSDVSLLGIGKLCSLRRYYMTLARQWPDATQVCVHGVNYFGTPKDEWWKSDDFRARLFGELAKIETYLRKGDIVEVQHETAPSAAQEEDPG